MKGKVVIAPVLLAIFAGIALPAQEVPLPEVRRQPVPTATVSEECSEPVIPDSRRPVTTPIIIAEEEKPPAPPRRAPSPPAPVEEVAEVVPPPGQMTAHQSMTALQRAAGNGSYEQFAAALSAARLRVAAMPAGSDKRAFESALDVYADIDQIWKYAVTDPMGAFYDNQSLPGVFAKLSRKYPGYAGFIKPLAVRDSAGNELYPTTETRRFLEAEAAKQLRGVRLPSPAEPPPVVAERPPAPAPARPPVVAEPRPSPPVRRPAPVRREPPPPVLAEPVEEEPAPATAAPPPLVTEPEPTTALVQPPETAVTPPPPEREVEVEDLLRREQERRGLSTNILLLIAFAVLALIALALLVRAFRSRPAAEATLLPREPVEGPAEEQPPAAATEADWIDPETRHWIEDANKSEKPPN